MKNLLLLTLLLAMVPLAGCKKKDKGTPPVLPPAESMLIDFSNFTLPTKSADFAEIKGTNKYAWNFAATVAGTWQSIIKTTLFIPVSAFKLAADQTPKNVSGNMWEWKYISTFLNAEYTARLTGQSTDAGIEWKLYISKTDGFTDFLWLEGMTQQDGNSGTWTLYHSNETPVQFLQIDWEKTGSDIGYIKYTYLKNDTQKNAFIEYGLTENPLNAYYTVHYYNGAKWSDVDIEWSTSLYNGRVKSIDYLTADNNWHCWDSNKIDVVCQ
jgi:hypothetical protein